MRMPLSRPPVSVETTHLLQQRLTRAGPRTRAPLGVKTTNAKSRAFQTPAPPSSAKAQKASPRLRRPKVKVHQPEIEHETKDDVPEVEYMPPKEVPLEEDMGDYLPKDWTIPSIDDQAMRRGIWEAYHNPIEDDGRTRKQRQFEEEVQRERKQRDQEFNKVFEAQMARDHAEARRYMGIEVPKEMSKGLPDTAPKRARSGLSTVRARSAAAVLSPVSVSTACTAPVVSAKSRVPTGLIASKKTASSLAKPATSRQGAAIAASKSTIGYAQGRVGRTASAARLPLSNVTKPAPFSATTRRPPIATSRHIRSASASASTLRSRDPLSRCSSTSTNATLIAPEAGVAAQTEQPYRTAADVERELELLMLSRSDDEEEDAAAAAAWSNSFSNQLMCSDILDEEFEGFEFQLPDGF